MQALRNRLVKTEQVCLFLELRSFVYPLMGFTSQSLLKHLAEMQDMNSSEKDN